MCLTISCFPLFQSVTNINNCSSCKMEHHTILRFLFEYGWTTIFLVGGLGVEDKQNDTREATILFTVNLFYKCI